MNIDRRQRADLERVADRPAVMRPGARVHDQRIRGLRRLMQALDERAFLVGVEEARLEAEVTGPVPDAHLQLDQGESAVVLRVALSEHVEVHAVHHLDPVRADHAVQAAASCAAPARISSIAAAISWLGTSAPTSMSPGACISTRFWRSPC